MAEDVIHGFKDRPPGQGVPSSPGERAGCEGGLARAPQSMEFMNTFMPMLDEEE